MSFKMICLVFSMVAFMGQAQSTPFDTLPELTKTRMNKQCANGDADSCLGIECLKGTGDKVKCEALENKNKAAIKESMTTMTNNVLTSEETAAIDKLSKECKAGNQTSCAAQNEQAIKNMKKVMDAEMAKEKAKCDGGNAESCKIVEEAKAMLKNMEGI